MPSEFLDPIETDTTDVLTALQNGDYGAFEELYRTRFEDLFNYASTFVSADDASDVVQEVFVAIWNNRETLTLRADKTLYHYLLRAVRNRALKVVRHAKVRDSYGEQTRQSAEQITQVTLPESDEHDLPVKVQALIESLPARSREVLTLRWYHGLAFDEIASLMGISYGYAHVLHVRALAMVRQRLGIS